MKCKFIVENFTHESSYTDLVKAIKAIVGGLGKFHDDIVRLEKATKYLLGHK